MKDRFDVTGKVAIVTGSTKGLGQAIAHGLSDAGAKVVVSSRKPDLCDEVAKAIAAETGGETMAAPWHAGDWDGAPDSVDRVIERFGRVDILVNNAAIAPQFMSVADMTSEFWDKVMSVNLKGPLRLCGLVAPRMGERGGGAIINVASVGAYKGSHNNSAYSVSKAGLINLTQAMASEWAPLKVRVNSLCPGPFVTDMMLGGERSQPGYIAAAAERTMLKRAADPDELVGAVIYLASDASAFVTGEDHIVAGGWLR
jgi:NAD(P)-dependent dehydrogenase (short-subunit alcohol dehydrogenase family)